MKKPALLFYLLILLYGATSSCNTISPKDYEFYYYPSRNIYYDVSNKEYIYSLDGGQTWDSLFLAADLEPSILGNKQTLHSAARDIWINNDEHIQQYNGHKIDVTRSDTVAKEDLASERKTKKVTTSAAQKKETEKKPGFFKRLFGKKN